MALLSCNRPLTLPPAAVPAPGTGRPPPMALAPSLVRNVRCSKEARRALASDASLVTWVSVTAADVARSEEAGLLAVPSQQSVFEEWRELFGPDGLDPANHELTPASAVALVRSFDLQPTDRFIDLGSARGGGWSGRRC